MKDKHEAVRVGDIVKLRKLTDDELQSEDAWSRVLVASMGYIDVIINGSNPYSGDRFVLVTLALDQPGLFEGFPLSKEPAGKRGWRRVPPITFAGIEGLSEDYELSPIKILIRPGTIENKVGSVSLDIVNEVASEKDTVFLVDNLPEPGE